MSVHARRRTPKETRQTKEKLPDDEPAVVLCIALLLRIVAPVVKGTGTVAKLAHFLSPLTAGWV
jgi:hypothetical protein